MSLHTGPVQVKNTAPKTRPLVGAGRPERAQILSTSVLDEGISVRERGVEPTLDRERTSLPLGILYNSWVVRQGAWGR